MKKIFAIVIALALSVSLVACGTAPVEPSYAPIVTPSVTTKPAPTPTPTPAPTPTPEPEGESALVLAHNAAFIAAYLKRGDSLEVLELQGDYAVTEREGERLLVENKFLRNTDAMPYEEKIGYADKETGLYDNAYLKGDAQKTLTFNDKVKIIDEFAGLYLVEYEGKVFYVAAEKISQSKRAVYYHSGDNGGGGGSASTGADGGDIQLRAYNTDAYFVLLDNAVETGLHVGEVRVLADDIALYYGFLPRGEKLVLIEEDEPLSQVYYDHKLGYIESRFLRLESEAATESWTGYAKSGAMLYPSYDMQGTGEKLNTNTELKVLENFGDCYLVEYDEHFGYISLDDVSENQISYNYYDGGASGGGDDNGGWTAPVL